MGHADQRMPLKEKTVLNTESHLAAIQESMNDLMEREHRNLLLRSEAIIREQRTENERLRERIIELERELAAIDDERFTGGGAWNGDIP